MQENCNLNRKVMNKKKEELLIILCNQKKSFINWTPGMQIRKYEPNKRTKYKKLIENKNNSDSGQKHTVVGYKVIFLLSKLL